MKRVLSLVLALVLVLGSMPLAFADDHMTAGDELYDWGLIEGYSTEEKQLGEEDYLTRAQMMKLLAEVMGAKEDAAAYAGVDFFDDLEDYAGADTLNPYVNYAASQGWTNGVGDNKFDPAAQVSQEMVATFMMRALGYEPAWGTATASAAALGMVVPVMDAGNVTRGEVFSYMRQALDIPTTEGVALGEKLEIEGFVAKSSDLDIVSVEATKVNELKVTFNQAVDTEDITLAVTRGNVSVDGEVEWSADDKVATIETTAKMTAGTYTVTATSEADEDFEVTGSTEVTSQGVAEIVILNDVALTGDERREAYVYYDVLDQYGESMRLTSSIKWNVSTSDSEPNENRAEGMLTVTDDGEAFTYGDRLYVTGVNIRTGVSVSKELTVGMEQAIDSIEFEGFVKKGSNELLEVLPSGFKSGTYSMAYSVMDQNGNKIVGLDASDITNDVTFISDNVLLIKELDEDNSDVVVVDGIEYFTSPVEPGINVNEGGEVNITMIATKTGNQSVINVAVGENKILKSFTILAPEGIVADGEGAELPFEAYDQNGNEVTNFVTLAEQAEFNELSFTASNGYLKLSEKDDGTALLEWIDSSAPTWGESQATDGQDRRISLTAVLIGGDTSNLLLSVSDKARPEAIKEVDMAEVLVERGFDEVSLEEITFLDQYGREMDDDDNEDAIAFFTYFDGSTASSIGRDFTNYDYYVKVKYTGTADHVELNDNLIDTTEKYYELDSDSTAKVNDSTDKLKVEAASNVVTNSRSGFSLRFEIARYDDSNQKEEVISTSKISQFSIVDISAVSNLKVAELSKFFIGETAYSDSAVFRGNSITDSLTGASIQVAANTDPYDHVQEIEVSGTYNGKDVMVPADYIVAKSSKLDVDGIKGTDGEDAVEFTLDNSSFSIKWSDLYDETSAQFVRKDGSTSIEVRVFDLDDLGVALELTTTDQVVDVITVSTKFSDELPEPYEIVIGEEATLDPSRSLITIDDILDLDEDAEILDQYAVDYTDPIVKFKVSEIVENPDGYASNNFSVEGNDQEVVTITGAERGDTFSVTIKAYDRDGINYVSEIVEVTVGADKMAKIIESTNAYVDVLVGDDVVDNNYDTAFTPGNELDPNYNVDGLDLEYQRKQGLN